MGEFVGAGEPQFRPYCMMTILFVVGLPSGKAISESVFSQGRYIATSFRSVMGCDTVCAILSAKWNSENMTTNVECSAKPFCCAISTKYRYTQDHKTGQV